MVDRTRELEMSLGDGIKKVEGNELETVGLQRRCVRAGRDIEKGSLLSADDLTMLRPCPSDGIGPFDIGKLIGKEIKESVSAGEHLTWHNVV